MTTICFQNASLTVENNSLQAVLAQQGYKEGYFAVALNRQFVPRSEYAATILQDGDLVEIITPMQGG